MGFGKFSSKESVNEIPHFQLPNGNDILKDSRSHEEYEKYQRDYKTVMGVFPELDKKNFPVCAVPSKKVLLPVDLKNSIKANKTKGMLQLFGGAALAALEIGTVNQDNVASAMSCINGAHLIPIFETDLEIAIHKFKYAYSLMFALNFEAIDEMKPCEYFSEHSLGFKKSEDGRYYEGTWENGELLYGLTYIPGTGAFIGTYADNQEPDEGVMFDGTNYQIGLFKDGELDCLHGVEITVNVHDDDDDYAYIVEVGGFEKGRRNGLILQYSQTKTGQVYINEGKFNYGDEVKQSWIVKKLKDALKGAVIYLAIICDLVAVVSLFLMGDMGSTALLLFAVAGIIGAFFTWLTIVITKEARERRKAFEAKKKELAELKKKNYISK